LVEPNATRILLIEDNPGDARLMQEMLAEASHARFNLGWSDTLSSGLERLAQEEIDLLLLDLSLPESTGINTVVTCIQRAPDLPIIVLTGTDDEALAVRAVQMGAQDYLVKGSVHGDLLRRAIRYALERHRMAREREDHICALRTSEARYRQLVDTMSDWAWEVDSRCVYTSVSGRCVDILGYTPEEILGKTPFDLMLPDEAGRFREAFEAHAREKKPLKDLVNWNVHKDGRGVCLLSDAVPILDDSGHLLGYRGVDRDITRRVEAEEQLRALSERHEAILASVPDIIAEVDVHKVYTWMNRAGLDFFGEDAIGREAEYYFAGEQDTYETVQPVFNGTDDIVYVESWQRRRDGERRLLGWWCRVLKDAKGNTIGALSTARDVTAEREAVEDLRVSGANLTKAQEVAKLGSWSLDLEKNELLWSDEIYRMFGVDRDGTPITHEMSLEAVHPDDREFANRSWAAALDGEPYDIDYRIVIGGEVRWVREKAEVEFDEEGKPVRGIGTIQDITERKRAEDTLREQSLQIKQANEELQAQNAELDEFTYIASHDLQEPLRKMTSFGQLLAEDLGDELSPQAEKDLAFIVDAVARMQNLVRDLLSLSRAGRTAVKHEPVALAECVRSAMDALSQRIAETGAEVALDDLPDVIGDRTMLAQLYQNLLSNALKFRGSEAPVVRFTAERAQGGLVLGVRDNGIGIKPEYTEQIFAPFKRLHGRGEYEGTGIGLAICRKTVERHGGRIWVESEPGRGAHFRFTLDEATGLLEEAA
jgi:PAS domain S-box-containing protein